MVLLTPPAPEAPVARPLTYRLRPTVECHMRPGGESALVLFYPSKAVVLHADWRPLLESISRTGSMALQQMAEEIPHIPIERIESFMTGLVRKGFLMQEGISYLDSDSYPTVTIVIPVRNRPREIANCLNSLARIDYPPEKIEIIVVDDASTDATPDVARWFSKVRLLVQPEHRQAACCRNLGAHQAKGDLLAFVDSDCTTDPLWLKTLVPVFRNPAVGAVGGLVDAASEQNRLDRYEMVKSALKMGVWFKESGPKERFFYVPACNLLVRRDLFLRLGGFEESLHVGEDVDFCWRLEDQGATLEYRPEGRVFHRHRNRLGAFFRRRFEYGTSEPLLQTLHPDRIKTLYLPPAETLFWVALILSLLLRFPLLLLVSGALWGATWWRNHRKLQKLNIPVGSLTVAWSTVRGFMALGYHCCSFISRYYLMAGMALLPFMPLTDASVIGMHLITGGVDYGILRPRLSLPMYLFYFSVEQIAYQCGVWWGCIRHMNFHPVFPVITHRNA